jgi:exodeoxyribonuclease VII large subunit
MSEIIQNKKAFSLLEVSRSIKDTLAKRYTSTFWVKAEMIKLNHYKHSGHCSPDLVEKNQGRVIAQIRANIWKRDYERINALFTKILKEPLKDGIKILFLAKISFDPVYGLSLHILDIDPSFTLGDLEREKQECIQKLRAEGLLLKNKSTSFPLLPQRIAIISVETSKGYADFLKIIENNLWGYAFFHYLFPSILQGEKAVDGIIYQLARIKTVLHHFDVVAIIRGGGGDVGLACYNDYQLSRAIANFPIPVITGIGHATNQTVAEMISYENAITPSKLAEMLMQYFHNFAQPVNQAQQKIVDKTRHHLSEAKSAFRAQVSLLKTLSQNVLKLNHQAMTASGYSLRKSVDGILKN